MPWALTLGVAFSINIQKSMQLKGAGRKVSYFAFQKKRAQRQYQGQIANIMVSLTLLLLCIAIMWWWIMVTARFIKGTAPLIGVEATIHKADF